MIFEVFSQKAKEFGQTTHDLDPMSESGVVVWVVDSNGWLKIMLELDEDTTHQNIRDAIPLALKWRNRLLEWQGPLLEGGDNWAMNSLHLSQERGASYKDLANQINRGITEYLNEFNEYLKELKEAEPHFKTKLDFFMWRPQHRRNSLEEASELMTLIGFRDDEIEDILNYGLECIQEGEPPFMDEYPVTSERMRSTIRNWREGKKFMIIKKNK